MASIINASTTGVGGVITTADNTGILQLQTANVSALQIDASQNITTTNKLNTASMPNGSVLQVVNSIITSKVTTTSSSFVSSGLSASIIPKSVSNKILIMVAGQTSIGTNGLDRVYFLIAGMTSSNQGDAGSGGTRCTSVVNPRSSDAGWAQSAIDIKIIDSPNTTSSVTYTLQWKTNSGYTAALGSAVNNDSTVGNTPTTMTLMEIAG